MTVKALAGLLKCGIEDLDLQILPACEQCLSGKKLRMARASELSGKGSLCWLKKCTPDDPILGVAITVRRGGVNGRKT
jgi:hypothetical protein